MNCHYNLYYIELLSSVSYCLFISNLMNCHYNMYYIELLSSVSYCLSPTWWTVTTNLMCRYFQQDDAPPHYALTVRAYLNHTFPGRAGSLFWPPRPPDLTPCDFWLWGTIKEHNMYGRRINDINELKGCDINYSRWNVCAGFKCYC